MNLFRNKFNTLHLIGEILSYGGLLLFTFTFWLPFGFHLSGDPLHYGPYIQNLALTFPLAGTGVITAFIGQLILKKNAIISLKTTLFMLIILAIIIGKTFITKEFEEGVSIFAIWAIAFFIAAIQPLFSIDHLWKKILLTLSLIIGSIANYTSPELNISTQIIAIIALATSVLWAYERESKLKQFSLLILTFIVFTSFNIPIILMAIAIFSTQKVWINRARKKSPGLGLYPALILLIILTILAFFRGEFTNQNNFLGHVIQLFQSHQTFLWGVGHNKLIPAIINNSDSLIQISSIHYHSLGFINSLYEKGFLLILAITALAISQINSKKKVFSITLFLVGWFFTIDLLQTPNGIFTAMALIFANNQLTTIKNTEEK